MTDEVVVKEVERLAQCCTSSGRELEVKSSKTGVFQDLFSLGHVYTCCLSLALLPIEPLYNNNPNNYHLYNTV